jgi:hypothetical protein
VPRGLVGQLAEQAVAEQLVDETRQLVSAEQPARQRALPLAPDAPGQQLALAEALLRRSRPASGGSHMADYRMAANLAAVARAARRRWRADSTPAAEILLPALALGGDERSAIR